MQLLAAWLIGLVVMRGVIEGITAPNPKAQHICVEFKVFHRLGSNVIRIAPKKLCV